MKIKIFNLGNNLFGEGTTGSKIVQKELTFPTAVSVFIAPLLTYGMPDGGYKYGDTIKKYNDIVGNTKKARAEAANELLNLIKNYEFEKDEPLNVIGHSHGGNDVKEYSHLVGGNGITGKNGTKPSTANAYLFATPNRKDYVMKDGVFDNYYNIYNKNDKLTQDIAGGVDFIFGKIPNIFKVKNPSQTTNEAGAINIPVDQDYTDYSNTFNNFTNNLENSNGNIFYKLLIDFETDNAKGQLKNHTEMKNPETVNEIYNQNSIRNRENLKRYDNFINKIRK